MNYRYFVIVLSLIFNYFSEATYGQRVIKGQVLDEESLEPLPAVYIYATDTTLLGETNLDGFFEVNLFENSNQLIVAAVGYEWANITIPKNCQYIEFILLIHFHYHYKSHNKIDRLRKKRFDKIPELHLKAFQKRLFNNKQPCYHREFIPDKPILDEIRDEMKALSIQNKENFKALSIGDTIRIPYGPNANTFYSLFGNWNSFECEIVGVVVGKNQKKGGYNVIFKITSLDKCQIAPAKLKEDQIFIGQIRDYNMRYFKLFIE